MPEETVDTTSAMPGFPNTIQIGIDFVALFIGIIAVLLVLRINRTLGGRISQALRYFVAGVICNVLAIGWSLFSQHDLRLWGMSFEPHQNLMSIGMIFFVISTTRFAKLIQ